MDTNRKESDYTLSEEFKENLQKQQKLYEYYIRNERYRRKEYPFGDGFMYYYCHFRACLACLLNNPDTRNDEDFKELCNYWQSYGERDRFKYKSWQIDFRELENRYNKLLSKPVFEKNPVFRDMFGYFVKSVYGLFNGDYWGAFFGLED